MVDHYQVLGLEPGANAEGVQKAFDELLVSRRARRQKTSDVHIAYAILSDANLRRAYDLARFGVAAAEKLSGTKDAAIDFAKDAIPDIDIREVFAQMGEVALKVTVVGSGAVAKTAEVAAAASRSIQVAASKRLVKES